LKKWICTVCGYEHDGDLPPDICPVCGVGPDKFIMIEGEAENKAPKRWKCTVCDYIHAGDGPPDSCPVCGVGPDKFVLLAPAAALTPDAVAAADEATSQAALDTISYGLYVVTSRNGQKVNGQCANSVFQVTSQPPRIAVAINKRNLTHEYIMKSGVLAVSVLRQDDAPMVRNFGYSSGRDRDKFAEVDYISGKNGCPILKNCVSYIEARVIPEKTSDVGTHTLFVADVTGGGVVEECEALTYTFFRRQKAKK
jgi:flavin reductase (DIM6/NTAB) family NADH-FMN oxidoreductase RutF/rubredoxin